MSQIGKISPAAFMLMLLVSLLAGCGDENQPSTFDTNTGIHPTGWVPAGHVTAALAVNRTCADCHGADLSGGISKVSCTQCHLGGVNSFHPAAWNTNILLHRDFVLANGDSSCRNAACHGANLRGVPQSGPACTLCHN